MTFSYQQPGYLAAQQAGLYSVPTYAPRAMATPLPAAQDVSSFQQTQIEPNLHFSLADRLNQFVFRAGQTARLKKAMRQYPLDPSMTLKQQVMVYSRLAQSLSPEGKASLQSLLDNGRLMDTTSEDGHTTLYHLYGMLTTPRAGELDGAKLMAETVSVLDKPFEMTQTFAQLSEKSAKQLLRMRNNPMTTQEYNSEVGRLPADLRKQPLSWDDINVTHSANCVGSSVMYYMAQKNPSELARHLKELTSTQQAFYETVKLSDISPRYPQNAVKKLQENRLGYTWVDPQTVKVKINLPQSALVRAENESSKEPHKNIRNGVEAAYQSALTNMATKGHYDPATDYRWDDNGQLSVGITEYEKTLMESVIKDNGGVVSITYQVATGKANPKAGEDGLPFLYGYTRTYEDTTRDIVNALKMGEPVIIGFTETLPNGLIPAGNGHEVTIVGAKVDDQGELIFRVLDTDDNIPTYVLRHAREIVPKIHHAGMPASLGLKIQDEIWTKTGFYIPDASDGQYFDPLSVTTDPLPADATIFFDDDYQQFMQERQVAQQQQEQLKALQQPLQPAKNMQAPTAQAALQPTPSGYNSVTRAIASGVPIQYQPAIRSANPTV